MIGSAENRQSRRRGKFRRARTAAAVGATATAMALGMTAAPAAHAITVDRDYTWDPVYTSGLYAGLLDFVAKVRPGVDAQLSDTISFHTGPPPSLGLGVSTSVVQDLGIGGPVFIYANIALNLNLRSIAGTTTNLYNTVAGIPQPGCGNGGGADYGAASYAKNCRYAVQLATLGSELNLLAAYRAQIASVQGNTPAGLISYEPSPTSTAQLPTQTNQALIILQNPDRPNGGLAARFPTLSKALGIDPTMPGAGKVTSTDGKTALNTSTLDLTWAYDPIGDFPAVFNLTALANSFAAALPLNLVTGGLSAEPLQGSSLGDIGLNLASILQFPLNITAANIPIYSLKMVNGQAFYSTLVPNELPITAAIGLPGTAINFALNAVNAKFRLGNPLGDILAPSMRIKVNTAYTDVLTPDKLNTCATGCGGAGAQTWAQLGYQAYDRTFGAYAAPDSVASAATPTPFGSVDPLTPEEKKVARADERQAFADALKAQFQKPFWGIIVPAQQSVAAATVKPAATQANQTAVQPVSVAEPSTPVADTAPATTAARKPAGTHRRGAASANSASPRPAAAKQRSAS